MKMFFPTCLSILLLQLGHRILVKVIQVLLRGLKKDNTPILIGYQIFHSFIRTHEGLKGKPPAEACGIEVKGKDKWITLIQNASVQNS